MTVAVEVATIGCFLMVAFVYGGYPLLLGLLGLVTRPRPIRKAPITPPVSLLISCFNEEAVLAAKLENALALDYPRERLEIVVVSDASDDRTDEIAQGFADRGVRLVRQPQRRGKTAALNLAVSAAQGEIVVFSDANAFYQPKAVRMLVRNFADDAVGYAVGEARYTTPAEASGSNESLYWRYEIWIKKMESRIHSVVGADGAIYAIRKALYEPLRDEDINDFVNPLQIIAKGYRGVYEAEAVALEETAGSYAKEFRRKARIVNRSFSGLMRVKQVLSPLRVGAFAFEIWTHKLLRWLAPAFMAVGVTGAFVLSLRGSRAFTVVSLLFVLFYLAFYLGYAFRSKLSGSPILLVPYYFMMVNAAAVVGVWHSLRGRVQVTWAPPRSGSGGAARGWTGVVLVHALLVLLSLYAVSRVRSL